MKPAPVEDPQAASLIAEAADLTRSLKAHEARLDEIKVLLRKKADHVVAARAADEDKHMVEFDSPAGVCSVIFVDQVPRLARGADTDALIAKFAGIGGLDWDQVFRKRVLLAQGWQEAVAGFPKQVQKALEKLVDWEASTPRVVFPK